MSWFSFSVALSAGWPDHLDRYSAFAGVCDHISRAAVATRGLAIPGRQKLISGIDHELAGRHVRLDGRLDEWPFMNGGSARQQIVIRRPGFPGQSGPKHLSRDDRFQRAAQIDDSVSKDLIGTIRQARQAGDLASTARQGGPNGHIDKSHRAGRQATMTGDRYARHVSLSRGLNGG